MTRTEFDAWFDHHCSRFTGVGAWLAKFPETGEGATQKSILEGWFLAVSGLTLANAKWATDQMFASEAKPRSFDDHPSRIVALNRSHDCGDGWDQDDYAGTGHLCVCEGTGMVEVVNDGQFLMSDKTPNPARWVSVACRCATGRWLNERRSASKLGHPLIVHDPETMRLGITVRHEEALVWKERMGIEGVPSREELRRLFGSIGKLNRE